MASMKDHYIKLLIIQMSIGPITLKLWNQNKRYLNQLFAKINKIQYYHQKIQKREILLLCKNVLMLIY